MLSVDTTELCLNLYPPGQRPMSLVTADGADPELVVRSKGAGGQLSEDRVVVSAGETVALLLDGLHCVF